MATDGYRIADEPKPSALARIAVQPLWPLFGHMFGGAWLAWPWFILNGVAVGSPTVIRECVTVAIAFVVSVAAGMGLIHVAEAEWIPAAAVPYCLILLTVFKLGVSYYLFIIQERTFELYLYFGGTVLNGFPIVILAAFTERRIFEGYPLLRFLLG